MSINMNISYKPSYYKKTNKDIYSKAVQETLKDVVNYSEAQAKQRAPVRTGNLRAHHSTSVESGGAELRNNCGYASYVAFGTSRQAAQNYPLAIVKDIDSQGLVGRLMKQKLDQAGLS